MQNYAAQYQQFLRTKPIVEYNIDIIVNPGLLNYHKPTCIIKTNKFSENYRVSFLYAFSTYIYEYDTFTLTDLQIILELFSRVENNRSIDKNFSLAILNKLYPELRTKPYYRLVINELTEPAKQLLSKTFYPGTVNEEYSQDELKDFGVVESDSTGAFVGINMSTLS